MNKRTRPTFSPEFRLESAQLVVDQNYTVLDAAGAMGVGKSTGLVGSPTPRRARRKNTTGYTNGARSAENP